MAYLGNPQETAAVLKKYGFSFRKKYGQNFLIDPRVLNKIVDAAQIGPEDTVLEIGPGIGTLTQYLAERAKRVIAVEIDGSLLPILEDTLSEYGNVRIIHGDILKVDLEQLIREENHGEPIRIAANLPYYITTPIIMNLLERRIPAKSITVMVQREVAQRMQAGPGGKDYGALSLAVQYYAETYLAANVPPNCFIPRPEVSSAVIRLTPYAKPPVRVRDEKLMFALIRAAFGQRRKTLFNGLRGTPGLPFDAETAAAAIREAGLRPDVRGETLTLEQFAGLTDILISLSESEAAR